mmetsp:Transcript_25476/g.79237  ORF Transcript_25476/g.79237 Transcript_25476/m.79237 type:complete len:269 (-) Transcript_25476:8-814(-)
MERGSLDGATVAPDPFRDSPPDRRRQRALFLLSSVGVPSRVASVSTGQSAASPHPALHLSSQLVMCRIFFHSSLDRRGACCSGACTSTWIVPSSWIWPLPGLHGPQDRRKACTVSFSALLRSGATSSEYSTLTPSQQPSRASATAGAWRWPLPEAAFGPTGLASTAWAAPRAEIGGCGLCAAAAFGGTAAGFGSPAFARASGRGADLAMSCSGDALRCCSAASACANCFATPTPAACGSQAWAWLPFVPGPGCWGGPPCCCCGLAGPP